MVMHKSNSVHDNAVRVLVDSMDQGIHELEWHGFPVRLIKQPWGELLISLHGAQVLHFQPIGEHPILWLTSQPKSSPSAIRGGVPLCWPWFGKHPEDEALPAHGVARTDQWQLIGELVSESGGCWILAPEENLWSDLSLSICIIVDHGRLTVRMTTENIGQNSHSVSQALHSYFAISSLGQAEIRGLAGCLYIDKLQAITGFELDTPFFITQETDRIYSHNKGVLLVDHGWQRVLSIIKQCSGSTVVWNPGAAAKQLVDVGLSQVDDFVCVEAARIAPFDNIILPVGESVNFETTISLAPYEPAQP